MKSIHVSNDPLMIEHLRNVLEARGIVCIVRNTHFNSIGFGGLYPTEAKPQLLVEDDADASAATRLVEEILSAGEGGEADWTCPGCGERIEGHFAACWRCGEIGP